MPTVASQVQDLSCSQAWMLAGNSFEKTGLNSATKFKYLPHMCVNYLRVLRPAKVSPARIAFNSIREKVLFEVPNPKFFVTKFTPIRKSRKESPDAKKH